MKKPIIVAVTALALASAAAVAQERPDSAVMQQRVTVTAAPGDYEVYEIALDTGYSLQARVGSTHRQYVQAVQSAAELETLRKQDKARGAFVTVAIDNSAAPGSARQIRLTDGRSNTLAIVDVHCKRVAPAGDRCQLFSLPVRGQPRLAVLPDDHVPLAQVRAEVAH